MLFRSYLFFYLFKFIYLFYLFFYLFKFIYLNLFTYLFFYLFTYLFLQVHPKDGPLGGKTFITIKGKNLGTKISDVDGIKIGESDCDKKNDITFPANDDFVENVPDRYGFFQSLQIMEVLPFIPGSLYIVLYISVVPVVKNISLISHIFVNKFYG